MKAIKKRKKVAMTEYANVEWIPATSNAAERFSLLVYSINKICITSYRSVKNPVYRKLINKFSHFLILNVVGACSQGLQPLPPLAQAEP